MKKLLGPIISLITILICLPLVEVALNLVAPVRDPYEAYKYVNQYVKSEFPPNYFFQTEVEHGLPGVRGRHLFTINNMGYRGDRLTTPKPDGEFRIFLVGGSSAECFYLDDSASIGFILQDRLNEQLSGDAVRVYNAGKSGDASDDHVSMLVHRIVHLEPDMVIVFSGINDLSRSIYGYDYLHYVKGDPRSGYSILKFVFTEFQIGRRLYYLLKRLSPTDEQVLEEITEVSNYRAKIDLRKSAPVSNKRPKTDVEAYAKNLRTIVGTAQAQGIQLVFMTQQSTWNSAVDPEAQNWHWMLYRNGVTYREDFMDEALESYNDVIREIARKHDVPLYDLATVMPKSLDYFYDDVHFNVPGAKKAGTALASFILEQGLLEQHRAADL
jgi:lysophospholipase L1-like esterase